MGCIRGMATVAVLLAWSGCTKDVVREAKDETQQPVLAAPTALAGEVSVAFGDCAGASAVFVSGPRPQAFDAEQTEATGASGSAPDFDADGKVHGGILGDEPEGGGSIGSGRYGTTSPSSGTGSGYGGFRHNRRRAGPYPQVRIGKAMVEGDLHKDIIRRFMRRKLPQIKYCYEKQLLVEPGLAGPVQTAFTISPDGKVLGARAEGVHPKVSACIRGVISRLTFPKPKGGGIVKVSYPFEFSISQGKVAVAKPEAGNVGVNEAYRPGAKNPLRGHSGALEACFRKQNKVRHAEVVVEVTRGKDGAVATAKTHGLADAAVSECVAGVARKATWNGADTDTQRCSLAFGPMPVEAAPGVDIDAESVRYRGAVVAKVADIVADESNTWKVDGLHGAVAGVMTAKPAAVVQTSGPILLRPLDGTPMKVVNRVITTLRANGAYDGLARKGAAGWEVVLGPKTLPVVPIPFGTGRGWRHPPPAIGIGGLAVDEWPKLSLLVTEQEVWLGVSKVKAITRVVHENGKPAWAAVVAQLREYRDASYFKGSSPFGSIVELAAADGVPYGDFMDAIAETRKAGIEDWRHRVPNALSTRFAP